MISLAREPPRKVQHRRQGAERSPEVVQPHAHHPFLLRWLANRVSSPDPPRSVAPEVPAPCREDPSVLQALAHRGQSRACQEALLGQLRGLLHVFRFFGNCRWRKVRPVRNLFYVSDLTLGS